MEKSKLHIYQKFGKNRSIRLAPMLQNRDNNVLEESQRFKPHRNIKNPDSRTYFKKAISVFNNNLVASFFSFQFELKDSLSISPKIAKKRVRERLNFSDTSYLCQYPFSYIKSFFQNYAKGDVEKPGIFVDFYKFGK